MIDAVSQFENTDVEKYNQMMLSMYFGTLESVYVISRQLGYNHTHLPSFASSLMFEVAKDSENGVLVTASYNKVNIPFGGDCVDAEQCKYNDFISFIETLKAEETELSGCKPADDFMYLTQSLASSKDASDNMNMFTIFILIAGAFSLLIGAVFGHMAAKKENKRRRIKLDVFDQEAILIS
jgi:hypothetical protein